MLDNIQKFTIETYARKEGINRQAALNKISRLKKQGFVQSSGGGKQKRIYTITNTIQKPTNGFYDIVNKYSPEKLVPQFKHHVSGTYTVEHAIIDGIKIGDSRTREATMHLFRHVTNWTRLFKHARKEECVREVKELYDNARIKFKVKKMPQRYSYD